MQPFGNDLKSNFEFNQSLAPAARAASANGSAIDCGAYDGPLCAEFGFGTCTDGGYTPSLEESEDGTSNFTAITPYEGSFSEVTDSAGGSAIQSVMFKSSRRYVRCVLTESTAGTTGVPCYGNILGRNKNVV